MLDIGIFQKAILKIARMNPKLACREIREETGIENVEFLDGFKGKVEYYYRREHEIVHKEVVFFLAKTDSQKVILSNEHIAYSWNDYDNALAKLTYKSAKDILVQAQNFLKVKYLQ